MAGPTAGQAGASPGRGDRRKRLLGRAALGVAVAVAVALGSFVLMGGGHRPSDRGTGSDRQATTRTPVDTRPEPSLIVVHLDSSPPGARVYLAGEQVGTTPLKRAFPRSNEPMRFRLEQDGYQPRLIDIACDHDQSITIPLEPLPR